MDTLVLAPFSDEGLVTLRRLGRVAYEPWVETQRLYDPQELGARLTEEGFEAVVVEADFLFEELFEEAAGLRFAAMCRAELNQVDLEAATGHGVVVTHTPGRNAQAVAELALGLMLSLARGIPQAHDYVSSGRWEDPTEPYRQSRSRELANATLGVIGLGAIGRRVARLAKAIGMEVQAYDPYVAPEDRGVRGVRRAALEALLQSSDFVTVHVPDTPETAGMLGRERLGLLKPTAYLVNVTSPSVLDAEALAETLGQGLLAGAALDVHDAHPIPPTSPLLGVANVLLTPHIGGATGETVLRHSRMVASDLERFAINKRPAHLANPAVWPRRRR